MLRRDAAREAWIKRFQGYFGDPLRLDEYRRGEIAFGALYDSALRHIGDMVNEAGRYAPEADPFDDWPEGYPPLCREET
jgi:hypothetical protein